MSDTHSLADTETRTSLGHGWSTTVWDDPVNLMPYVTYVFRQYFGYSREDAEQLMLQVHTAGKASVASGDREQQERHVAAMHGYGLQATVERI
ncbi:MAG TPA: ATP-dependent Clp protease adapter ClpS [Candidatus Agrococcus pullicola]|uniref:ATP-dependent Clp protease adapter ClpS n=1 Tax=Candidatus Agrococcus pullicola TaxID=2838429 RepID=A0A9D1YVK1_9MICO|nr:ATP-dependent Clp protease adapter ClpS [Candidatus Agrococcus pullicola]